MTFGRQIRKRASPTVAILALLLCGCGELDPGPLKPHEPSGYGGIIVETGHTFSDGFEAIAVPGDSPLKILSVELIDTDSGLELVDVLLYGEEREMYFQVDPDFPPSWDGTGPLRPAIGAILLPSEEQTRDGGYEGYGLIMGIKVTKPGKFVRGGYRLEYEVDGQRYGWDSVAQITVCTPDFVESDGMCSMEIPVD